MGPLRALMLASALALVTLSQAGTEPHGTPQHGGGHSVAHGGGHPLVINTSRQSSGWHNQGFPSAKPGAPARAVQPSWGRVERTGPSPAAAKAFAQPKGVEPARVLERAGVPAAPGKTGAEYRSAELRPAAVVHHHAYAQGYVRQKLQKLGVKTEPSYITDRSEMIHTDRAHSAFPHPSQGPGGRPSSGNAITPRGADAARLSAHMALVSGPQWQGRVETYNRGEGRAGHYYWHNEGGLDFCHYRDASGYQWYGWYFGAQFFWTRNYDGRWWWYDADYDRWAFYNDDFWWWQDPYHVGDLYCYDKGDYIAVNSDDDRIAVTQPESVPAQSVNSPDGSRSVKLVAESQDAFLYDTTGAPAFEPIYLASGVQRVEFSDAANGRPMEIVLKLNDGSFDLFDSQGRAYNPGADEGGAPPAADAP
jgi:hypothetical protein